MNLKHVKILSAILLLIITVTHKSIFSFDTEQTEQIKQNKQNKQNYFSIFIERDGQEIPIEEHQAQFARGPFTLIIKMSEPMGLLVNFSITNYLYEGFASGKSLEVILDQPDRFMGMAEGLFNEDKTIVIDDILPHYLYYDTQDNHRFDSVSRENNWLICKRDILYYAEIDGFSTGRYTPIERIKADTLYLVFFYSVWSDNYESRIELQRDWLKIDFIGINE